ncbi:SDR family oxidoreductase [Legionella londiniensis]|uniref:NAD-dependent epimerase/dehydratase n=1 Tax=Legionella londiniensis TaxID=45068 RepID=A0A0W0VN41_9GAMM|nr:SDR family oxidoreductase [Legionella londiniensis]KTD21595.1 NAD-dependent epimerase/dehydratase [Legionella londiniensis]STX93366.1 oxidoreductase (NAD-dependent epimerase/dehydratase) [Legionella londiniensis]
MNKKDCVGIFGFGYCAAFLAFLLGKKNMKVLAASRQPNLSMSGHLANLELIDFSRKSAERVAKECNAILITIPPDETGHDPVLRQFEDVFLSFYDKFQWVGYLSSTGVYGDHQGQWVDETSELLCPSSSGKKRISAEKAWLNLYEKYRLPVHIFRLAGIYGPARCSIDKILSGRNYSLYKPNHVFSRIHVEDIAGALLLSMQNPAPGEIYNLSDDYPAAVHEVDAFAARLLGQSEPELIPVEQADLSELGKEFFLACKRVSAHKIKSRLGFTLKYPSYREGLEAILSGDSKMP